MPQSDVFSPSVKTFHNALVLPVVDYGDHGNLLWEGPYYRFLGGVYCRTGGVAEALLVRPEGLHESVDDSFVPGRNGEYQAPVVDAAARLDGHYLFCGRAFPHFAHFIGEGLARIWYAKQHPELTLVWAGADGYLPHQREMLDIIGVQNPAIFVQEPTELESLVVPSQGHVMPTFYAPYFLETLGVVEPAPIIKGKKTYISRAHGQGGGYINEGALEALLRQEGWEILHPEELPVAARFDLLSSSEIVLMVEGSAMTSFLFFRELYAKVFTLCRNDPKLTGYDISFRDYFGAIARDKGLDYWRLDLPKTWVGGKRTGARFELDLNAFSELMRTTDFLSSNLDAVRPCNRPYPHDKAYDAGIAATALASVTTDCDPVSACVYRAGLAKAADERHRAEKALRTALSLMPDSAYLHWRLAGLMQEDGALAIARDELVHAIKLSNEDVPAARIQLAKLHLELEDMDNAVIEARRAVSLNPAIAGPRFFLADLLIRTKQLAAAQRELEQAVRVSPLFAPARVQLSKVLAMRGKLHAAIAQARAAVGCDAAHPGCHVHLGHLLARQGDFAAATASVHNALTIDPAFDWAKSTLVWISDREREALQAIGSRASVRRSFLSLMKRLRSRLRRALPRAFTRG